MQCTAGNKQCAPHPPCTHCSQQTCASALCVGNYLSGSRLRRAHRRPGIPSCLPAACAFRLVRQLDGTHAFHFCRPGCGRLLKHRPVPGQSKKSGASWRFPRGVVPIAVTNANRWPSHGGDKRLTPRHDAPDSHLCGHHDASKLRLPCRQMFCRALA